MPVSFWIFTLKPVSSYTSRAAARWGHSPRLRPPPGIAHMPLSSRWMSRIFPPLRTTVKHPMVNSACGPMFIRPSIPSRRFFGQTHVELAALPTAVALRPDLAVVTFHKLLGDVQAQAGALNLFGDARLALKL